MEKLEIEQSLKKSIEAEAIKIESSMICPTSGTTCLKKTKPRAIVFKANDKDFCSLKDFIKTQFPQVEVVYVTTGPVESFLRVTKSIPFELQNSSEQPNYTVE